MHRKPSNLLVLSLLALTSYAAPPETPSSKPLVSDNSLGPVSITLTFDPPVVRLDHDTLLTVRIASPSNVTVKLPPLETRVKGFTVSGNFDGPPTTSVGKSIRTRNFRLTPLISNEYRIAPMAVQWRDPDTGAERWFPTKPVVLNSEMLLKEAPGRDIVAAHGPVWIYPGLKGFLGYIMAALGLAALGYFAWKLFRKVRRAVKLRRMSPRERALFELSELMARDLIGHHRVKDFYFELTLIVRTYIERAHAIRAPEQTTEEFLAAVSHDVRFSRDVVKRLREFMQAADLVKYAGFQPDPSSVDAATSTARNYIETDSDQSHIS
ncbi:MAG: hypothetical protein WCO42_05265 [bacterium]